MYLVYFIYEERHLLSERWNSANYLFGQVNDFEWIPMQFWEEYPSFSWLLARLTFATQQLSYLSDLRTFYIRLHTYNPTILMFLNIY